MLTGTVVTIAGFVPIGFAASAAGEYCFTLFAVVTIALLVSWLVAVIFAPLLSVYILKVPKAAQSAEPPRVVRWYRSFLTTGAAREMADARDHGRDVRGLRICCMPLIPRQFFPASDRPELLVDLTLPQNASIFATDTLASRFDDAAGGRSGRRQLEHLCRPGCDPLLPAARRAAGRTRSSPRR